MACILVVDDEEFVRMLIEMVLQREGYEVVHAGTVHDAMRMIQDIRPDVMTLDLMMPGRSGLELLRDIAGDPDLEPIPTLVITAVGLDRDLKEAKRLGAAEALSKPFSQRQLVDAVRSLLGANQDI